MKRWQKHYKTSGATINLGMDQADPDLTYLIEKTTDTITSTETKELYPTKIQ